MKLAGASFLFAVLSLLCSSFMQDVVPVEMLLYKGAIESSGQSNFELAECISSSSMIYDIETRTELEEDSRDSSFVAGAFSYGYFVDDYQSPAGQVRFKFEYVIRNDSVLYQFYDFEHEQAESKFESLGHLPKEWNEEVKLVFSKSQYKEILTDIELNVANAIRMVRKYCASKE